MMYGIGFVLRALTNIGYSKKAAIIQVMFIGIISSPIMRAIFHSTLSSPLDWNYFVGRSMQVE